MAFFHSMEHESNQKRIADLDKKITITESMGAITHDYSLAAWEEIVEDAKQDATSEKVNHFFPKPKAKKLETAAAGATAGPEDDGQSPVMQLT